MRKDKGSASRRDKEEKENEEEDRQSRSKEAKAWEDKLGTEGTILFCIGEEVKYKMHPAKDPIIERIRTINSRCLD